MYRKRREAAEKLLAQNRRPVKLPYKPSRLTVEQIKGAIYALQVRGDSCDMVYVLFEIPRVRLRARDLSIELIDDLLYIHHRRY